MKRIKLFEKFNKDQHFVDAISDICKKLKIEKIRVNPDGTVDVRGDVALYYKGLTKLPFKFGDILGNFDCDNNRLTSLEGSPRTARKFRCFRNNLTSLKGGPEAVFEFNCRENKITSFEGAPKRITKDNKSFYCEGNPIFNIWNLFWDYSKVELFNDYDIIQKDNKLVLNRLNDFLKEIGKPPVKKVDGYINIDEWESPEDDQKTGMAYEFGE